MRANVMYIYLMIVVLQGVRHALIGADPQPLDARVFSRRIPGFSVQVSEQLVAVFKDGRFLDGKGYLKLDPRQGGPV
jgi:hypothetical protein